MLYSLDVSAVRPLLQAVVDVSDSQKPLVDLRQSNPSETGRLVKADAGHSAWGHRHPASASITPVAFFPFGYTESELSGDLPVSALTPRISQKIFSSHW